VAEVRYHWGEYVAKGGVTVAVVHGSFVPWGARGFFFLFALDPLAEAPPAPAKGRGSRVHAQSLPAEQLYPVLRGLPAVNAVTCAIRIPGSGGVKPARFPGAALSVAAAAQWLIDLDAAFEGTALRPGQSLQAWSAAAKLTLELLGRGRFLPFLRAEAGCLAPVWSPAAPEPGDAIRLAQLEAALPDLCRAIIPPDRDQKSYRAPAAGALLGQFVQTAADALARLFLQGVPAPVPGEDRPSATHHWLLHLTGERGHDLPPGLSDAAVLYEAIDTWAAGVTGVKGHTDLRTGLRLSPPPDTVHGGWELELILQAEGDPPVTVPARHAWEAAGHELVLGGQRYRNAEQRLLADLPVMSRLFPPLEPLRFAPAPTGMVVDEEAVYALLEEGAALLQQAGFSVQLPAGLVHLASLHARMHLSPSGRGGESRFGLAQLVNVHWDLALGDQPISREELRRLAEEKRPLVMQGGRWIQVDQHALAAALRNLETYGERVELGAALRLAPEAEETTAEGWVDDLLTRLREPARIEPVPVPPGFHGTLRPYQERGLSWLAFLRRFGLGACLADDMGLGKTIQLIALLLHERQACGVEKPTLLVCPVSVAGNWRRELARFAPGIRVLIHHGAGRADAAAFADEALRHDVVITTYALVARDEESLAAVDWAGVVADEAQNLKNPATRHAQAIRRLPGGYRIAMTGTPVENHLGDLHSLFQFLNPGFLGSAEEFRRRYALPIERYRDEEAVARLRRQIGPLILRRVKTDPAIVNDLPEKVENAVYATLTVEQAALYEAAVEEMLERAAEAVGIQRHGAVLTGLTRLKQICNHPVAVTGDNGPLAGRSGKLERLTEMLREVLEEGDQALLFTQFARFGARLHEYLARALGCPVLFLDGSTPRLERDRLIARFQAGEAPLFILSLKAGGVGLNLTAANHVFHVDRWWNPAVEDQATDRAYRIGQTRRVMVHKLITAGTLEEKIDKLLADKRQISQQVIGDGGESWLGNLSTDELRTLIRLEREA
jgi:superfamily II DNA or RNA helicase